MSACPPTTVGRRHLLARAPLRRLTVIIIACATVVVGTSPADASITATAAPAAIDPRTQTIDAAWPTASPEPSEPVTSTIAPQPVDPPTTASSQPTPAIAADQDWTVDAAGNTVLGTSPAPDVQPGSMADQFIVSVEGSEVLRDVTTDLAAEGAAVTNTWDGAVTGLTATLDAAAVEALEGRPGVIAVEPDHLVSASATQTDAPWNLDRIDQRALPLNTTYSVAASGLGVTAYVIDSGIRPTHTDFGGRVPRGAAHDFGDGTGINDCNGHGTHVAGTIGGTVWGVAKAVTIVPVKILPCTNTTPTSVVIEGINWVIADHQYGTPAVANMSIGGSGSTALDSAVNQLVADGITVVVAAGNDNAQACSFSPARVPSAITVAASDRNDNDASFTNHGSCNDLFAPGVQVPSASYQSDTGSLVKSGTSMAAPHVTGAAALILQRNPSATPQQVWQTMSAEATRGVIAECCSDPDVLLRTATVPDAPVISGVVGGDGTVAVTVAAPASDGGSPVTGYVAEVRQGATVVASATSSFTTINVSGLGRGITYTVVVAATNDLGQGPWSASRSFTLSTTVPGAPAIARSVAGDGTLAVTATPPASDGGSPVTGYVAQVREGLTLVATATAPGTTISVGGLMRGTTYTVVVAATNLIGQGPWSSPTTTTLPTLPGAPAVSAVLAGDGPPTVIVTPPASDGGAPITSYVAEVRDGQAVVATATSPGTTITLGALTRGNTYTVVVAATNLLGQGDWSTPSQFSQPMFITDAPAAAALLLRTQLFVRGRDNALYTRSRGPTAQCCWGSYSNLGGIVTSSPAAVSRNLGAGAVDVFARGADNALWTRHFDGATWGGWGSLGGILMGAPAVVSTSLNTLDVFAVGGDNALWTRHFDGATWGGWGSLGGILTSDPAVASSRPGAMTVFARGLDNALWAKSFNGSAWGGWTTGGGILSTGPAVTSPGQGTLDVFVGGGDTAVWARTYDDVGIWFPWRTLGGSSLGAPAAAATGGGDATVFVRGRDDAVWSRSSGPGGGWGPI